MTIIIVVAIMVLIAISIGKIIYIICVRIVPVVIVISFYEKKMFIKLVFTFKI